MIPQVVAMSNRSRLGESPASLAETQFSDPDAQARRFPVVPQVFRGTATCMAGWVSEPGRPVLVLKERGATASLVGAGVLRSTKWTLGAAPSRQCMPHGTGVVLTAGSPDVFLAGVTFGQGNRQHRSTA